MPPVIGRDGRAVQVDGGRRQEHQVPGVQGSGRPFRARVPRQRLEAAAERRIESGGLREKRRADAVRRSRQAGRGADAGRARRDARGRAQHAQGTAAQGTGLQVRHARQQGGPRRSDPLLAG